MLVFTMRNGSKAVVPRYVQQKDGSLAPALPVARVIKLLDRARSVRAQDSYVNRVGRLIPLNPNAEEG